MSNKRYNAEHIADGLKAIRNRLVMVLKPSEYDTILLTLDMLSAERDSITPRVLTANEVFAPDFDGLVYIEFFDTITPALITAKTQNTALGTERWVATQHLGGAWMHEYMYGVSWRCWTKRPSDIQRKEVPFINEKSEG